jgi:hypothetical protein
MRKQLGLLRFWLERRRQVYRATLILVRALYWRTHLACNATRSSSRQVELLLGTRKLFRCGF